MTSVSTVERELALTAYHEPIRVETSECLQFIDVTDEVRRAVQRSGVRDGLVNVQTRHTTTAVLVGEHEPLLIEDLRRTLERLAPCRSDYRHDDFTIRTVNMCPDEQKNGHSHCKGLFLRCSECLNIVDGRLELGQWQRIFLIELDRPRARTMSVLVLGDPA